MRAGIIWLVLMGFGLVDGVETVMVLEERTGVVRLPAGRDRSAGLMSGMLKVVVEAGAPGLRLSDDEAAKSYGSREYSATARRRVQ